MDIIIHAIVIGNSLMMTVEVTTPDAAEAPAETVVTKVLPTGVATALFAVTETEVLTLGATFTPLREVLNPEATDMTLVVVELTVEEGTTAGTTCSKKDIRRTTMI
jgi:hypothetical protein